MPKIVATLTRGVEADFLSPEAAIASRELARLALKACPSFMPVIRWLIVSATRRTPRRPPMAIATAGQALERLPAVDAFRFAWAAFRPKTRVYRPGSAPGRKRDRECHELPH